MDKIFITRAKLISSRKMSQKNQKGKTEFIVIVPNFVKLLC